VTRERGFLRFSIGGVFTALLITAPFLMTGKIDGVITQYLHTTNIDTVLSANAHNLWWFITGGDGWRLDTERLGPLNYREVGLLLFAAATLLSVAVVWRDRKMLFLAASYESLAFYMLNTQIHENHSLAMFAPLAIAVASDRSVWWLYGAFTVTAVVNMTLHDPALLTWAGYDDVLGGSALAIPRWLNSATQLLLFGALTWRLISHLLRGKSTTNGTTSSGLLPTKAC
jgi:hypothetical protein